jgi:hypothetical protein
MAIETITREGDFVIRSASGKIAFRFHSEEDGFTISATQNSILMTDGEAEELMEWLKRRFSDAI